MSKVIYKPTGKAREYAQWACNLHNGCSNGCAYCYCKRGPLKTTMGNDTPTLKKGIENNQQTLDVFIQELTKNRKSIVADGGLFFSFSTDPCLPTTIGLTTLCISIATGYGVPCTILTKCAEWILDESHEYQALKEYRKAVTIGFTLTGCDELEPNASRNAERIKALKKAHSDGFKTFASVEPVIDFDKAESVIRDSADNCDEYKIGLLSGDRNAYAKYEMPGRLIRFHEDISHFLNGKGKKVYWKKSITDIVNKL